MVSVPSWLPLRQDSVKSCRLCQPRPQRPPLQLTWVQLQSCGRCSLTPLEEKKELPVKQSSLGYNLFPCGTSSVQDTQHRNGVTTTSCLSLLPHPHIPPAEHPPPVRKSSYSRSTVSGRKSSSSDKVFHHRNWTARPGAQCWDKPAKHVQTLCLTAGGLVPNSKKI